MMRAVILSSALGLLFLVRSSQADCPNPGWGSKPIPETSDVGFIVFTTDNSDGVYSSVGATGSLVDFLEPFDDGSNVGFRLTRELSSLVDCTSDEVLDASFQNAINGRLSVECSDNSNNNFPVQLTITSESNRVPTFNQASHTISQVSKRFPPGKQLSILYDFEIIVQDLDHRGIQPMEQITFTISDDTYNLFTPVFLATEQRNDLCSDKGNKSLEAFNLDFLLETTIPSGIPDTYSFKLTAQDESGNSDVADITIEFAQEDFLAPVFEEAYYFTNIDQPDQFSAQVLTIQPSPISAVDGDIGLNVSIKYSLTTEASCSLAPGTFTIEESSAEITWAAELSPECLIEDVIYIQVQARQEDDPSKATTIPVSIQLPGDKLNPVFTNPDGYTGSLNLQDNSISISPPISASDGDSYINDPISFSLMGEGSDMFDIDEASGVVSTSANFDADRLPPQQIVLQVVARQTSNPDRVATVPLTLTYPFNNNPPVFNVPVKLYITKDSIPGTVVTSEGDLRAQDTDSDPNVVIQYRLDLSQDPNAFMFKVDTYSNGDSVRITYQGNLAEPTLVSLVIQAVETGVSPERSSSMVVNVNMDFDDNFTPPETTTTSPGSTTSTTEGGNTETTTTESNTSCPTCPTTTPCPTTTSTTLGTCDPDTPHFDEPLVERTLELEHDLITDCLVFKAHGPDIEYRIASVNPADQFNSFDLDPLTGSLTCKPVTAAPKQTWITVQASNAAGQDETLGLVILNSGAPIITSGDFNNQDSQTVGYPDFVYLENFISMPLAQVLVANQDSDMTFSTTSDDFYIDDFGNVFAYDSNDGALASLCQETSCQIQVTVANGIGSEAISVVIQPVSADKITALEVEGAGTSTNPDQVLMNLNNLFPGQVWFRKVQYHPATPSRDGDKPVIFATALDEETKTFWTRDQVSGLLEDPVNDIVVVGDAIEVNTDKDGGDGSGDGNGGQDTALLVSTIILAVLLALALGALAFGFVYARRKRKDILFASSSIPDRDPSPMPSPKITTARETSSTFTRPEPESKTLNQYKPTEEKKEEVKQDLNESKIEKRPAPPPPLMGDSDSADKPVLDRKISFNDNAEVIRVKPMEKTIDDISEAEEDDDDDDGGDSSDNEELTAM